MLFVLQTEHSCRRKGKSHFGPQTFAELEKKEQGKILVLMNVVCVNGEGLVPIFKASFLGYLNQALPNILLLEILGYCNTRGCGQM